MFGIKRLREENERLRSKLREARVSLDEARARLEIHERKASDTVLAWSELRFPSELSADKEERSEQIRRSRNRAMFHLACVISRKATATPVMEGGRKVGVRYELWVRPYKGEDR